MLQQIGDRINWNDNARLSARTVVQQHSVFPTRISYERRTCSNGRRGALWFYPAFFRMLDISGSYIKGGLVREGIRSMSDAARGGVDESVMGKIDRW